MRALWIVAVLLVGVEGSLVEFETLIMKIAGRSGISYYSSYGCYCGAGGQGWPQDASDRCCFEHDCCYAKLTGCDPTTDVYTYRQEDGEIVCGGDDPCGTQICECDKAAAICFRDSMDTYDYKYLRFSPENCHGESQPC